MPTCPQQTGRATPNHRQTHPCLRPTHLQKLASSKGKAQEAEILTYIADPFHMVGNSTGAGL